MNTILALLHTSIIKKLEAKSGCSMAIVDQFADSRLIGKNFTGGSIKVHHTTGGEKYTAVAAASILARGAFLDGLKLLSDEYGVELPKGSGTNVAATLLNLKKHGLTDKLNMVAKLHFASVK
jgi:ribonuclease HIII